MKREREKDVESRNEEKHVLREGEVHAKKQRTKMEKGGSHVGTRKKRKQVRKAKEGQKENMKKREEREDTEKAAACKQRFQQEDKTQTGGGYRCGLRERCGPWDAPGSKRGNQSSKTGALQKGPEAAGGRHPERNKTSTNDAEKTRRRRSGSIVGFIVTGKKKR